MDKPKRIYQIAKQINISHSEIVTFLKDQGLDVTNHMSPVDEETHNLILKNFASDLYQIELDQKEVDRRALEEQRRIEEEERIRKADEEKQAREDEDRSRRDAEEQRRQESKMPSAKQKKIAKKPLPKPSEILKKKKIANLLKHKPPKSAKNWNDRRVQRRLPSLLFCVLVRILIKRQKNPPKIKLSPRKLSVRLSML